MDPQQLNLAITAMANLLSDQLSTEDFEFWTIVFTQLAQSMNTITALSTLQKDDALPFEGTQTQGPENSILPQEEHT